MVQEKKELQQQYDMMKGLLKNHTRNVKEGQQLTLKLKEQAKTIEALEVQVLEAQKEAAEAKTNTAWALNLWNEGHPPSPGRLANEGRPPSPGGSQQ